MSGKIQNRYSALVRELDITEYAPNYRITDDVVPVVILHEHCEGDAQSTAASQDGAGGPTTGAITLTPNRPGAHQITIYADWSIAVAAREAMRFRIDERTTGATILLLRYLNYGNANGMLAGHFELTFPKIHLPENCQISCDLLTAVAAGDNVTIGMLIQPV